MNVEEKANQPKVSKTVEFFLNDVLTCMSGLVVIDKYTILNPRTMYWPYLEFQNSTTNNLLSA